MIKCIKRVDAVNCHQCEGQTIRFGKKDNRQRYRCKACGRTQFLVYENKAYDLSINSSIAADVEKDAV